MKIGRKTLQRRWAITTVAALAVFAVLVLIDLKLRAVTGYGTRDLQMVSDPQGFVPILHAWSGRVYATLAGFSLGFDFLFMPLYGFALYYSGIMAAEAFAPNPGLARRILLILAIVPLVGAVCDAAENSLEMMILTGGPNDALARAAYTASNAKLLCFYVGLLLLAAALAGLLKRRTRDDGNQETA